MTPARAFADKPFYERAYIDFHRFGYYAVHPNEASQRLLEKTSDFFSQTMAHLVAKQGKMETIKQAKYKIRTQTGSGDELTTIELINKVRAAKKQLPIDVFLDEISDEDWILLGGQVKGFSKEKFEENRDLCLMLLNNKLSDFMLVYYANELGSENKADLLDQGAETIIHLAIAWENSFK